MRTDNVWEVWNIRHSWPCLLFASAINNRRSEVHFLGSQNCYTGSSQSFITSQCLITWTKEKEKAITKKKRYHWLSGHISIHVLQLHLHHVHQRMHLLCLSHPSLMIGVIASQDLSPTNRTDHRQFERRLFQFYQSRLYIHHGDIYDNWNINNTLRSTCGPWNNKITSI